MKLCSTFAERRGMYRAGSYCTAPNNLDRLKAPAPRELNSKMSGLQGDYDRLMEEHHKQLL